MSYIFLAMAPAVAGTDVKCVQQALLDAGHDPNGIDGAIGRGTRAAAASYLVATGLNLPILTDANATQWCRSIATAPQILLQMASVCNPEKNVSGLSAIAGQWFDNSKPAFGYAIFIKQLLPRGKVKGYYATPLFDAWGQSRSCVFFSGTVDESGSLNFVTSNNGRTVRLVKDFRSTTASLGAYSPALEWKSSYGSTTGWGRSFASTNNIEYRSNVELKVGQSQVIHGMRGKCGELPGQFGSTEKTTALGTLTLGDLGARRSRSCGGTTPAIEVVFTAQRVGIEQISLFGDGISVIVTE